MTDAPRYSLTTDPLALLVVRGGSEYTVRMKPDDTLAVRVRWPGDAMIEPVCIDIVDAKDALLAFARAVVERFGNVEQVDDHGHPLDLPAIGSVWRARDGRLMRVDQWTKPNTYPKDDYWANLTVMNAQPRQRRTTQMKRAEFGQGRFLVPDFKLSDKPLPKGPR